MRKLTLFLLICSFVMADSPLSYEKEKILELKRQKLKADADKLKNSWISPLNISVSKNRSVSANDMDSRATTAKISLNQDIFRSGGIWYAIDYAKAFKEVQKLGIDLEEAADLKQIYSLKTKIKRDELKLKQSKLILKNREIDVEIVKERYKAGDADISELNRVTIESDNARTSLINIQNLLRNEYYELKKIVGEKNIKRLRIPKIPLVDKKSYLSSHLQLLRFDKQIKSDLAKYKAVKSSYLPKVALNGSYGYSKIEGNFQNYESDEYSYGIKLSMPLNYNSKNDIESSKIAYLQSKLAKTDRQKELEYEYDKHLFNIKDYKEKIKVAKRMIKLYDELYDFTDLEVKAGMKTKLDLKSLNNSLKIQKLEQKIQEQNIILEKISLFFDIKI